LTVGHADIEEQCRDVKERLASEMLACRTRAMRKARDARVVLDTDEVPDEGMVYENGEGSTHLYPRSRTGASNARCVHDPLYECVIHEDAASENAQRGTICEGAKACGDAETTDGYANRDDADNCTKGESYKVGRERYERGDSPVCFGDFSLSLIQVERREYY